MDNTLFFGSCVVINMENDVASDMSVKEFEDIMEHLYGGFEDVDSEEETESDDDDTADLPKTKDGYVKDDFIVDSDEEDGGDDDDDEEDDIESEEEEIVKPKKKVSVPPKPKAVPKPTKKEKAEPVIVECSVELEEEEYLV